MTLSTKLTLERICVYFAANSKTQRETVISNVLWNYDWGFPSTDKSKSMHNFVSVRNNVVSSETKNIATAWVLGEKVECKIEEISNGQLTKMVLCHADEQEFHLITGFLPNGYWSGK